MSKGVFVWDQFVIIKNNNKRLGGMCGAILTSPFDVVKTRLQSNLFRHKHAAVGAMCNSSTVVVGAPRTTGLLYNFVETRGIIWYVSHKVFA